MCSQRRILQIILYTRERRTKMSKKNYVVEKHFKITVEQETRLKEIAKRCGLSESAYLRMLIEEKKLVDQGTFIMLKNLQYEIHKIGVNINQITRSINAGFYSDNDKDRLFGYLSGLNEQFQKVQQSILFEGES